MDARIVKSKSNWCNDDDDMLFVGYFRQSIESYMERSVCVRSQGITIKFNHIKPISAKHLKKTIFSRLKSLHINLIFCYNKKNYIKFSDTREFRDRIINIFIYDFFEIPILLLNVFSVFYFLK